jgi:hypothetical protein
VGENKQKDREKRDKLYPSGNVVITRAVKSRRVTCEEHIACMGEVRNLYKTLVEKCERRGRGKCEKLIKGTNWAQLMCFRIATSSGLS